MGGDSTIIQRESDTSLSVTIHNIGAAPAEDIAIHLLAPNGEVRARAIVARLDPPADLQPQTAIVGITTEDPITPDWRLVIDPDNQIPEICETNNAIAVGKPASPFVYLARDH